MEKFRVSHGSLTWIDLEAPSSEEMSQALLPLNIKPAYQEICLESGQLPTLLTAPESVVIVLRVYNKDAPADAATVEELTNKLSVFISEQNIVTTHRNVFDFISETKTDFEIEINKGTHSVTREKQILLHELFAGALYSFEKPLLQLQKEAENLETAIFEKKKRGTSVLTESFFLRRRSSGLKHVLRFTRETLSKVTHEEKLFGLRVRDLQDTVERMIFNLEEVSDNINQLINLHLSMSAQTTNEASHKTNEVMRILTVFSVFFLPLNFIAGIYGMNFEHMPELKYEHGYYTVLAGMLALALAIFLWMLTKGWIKWRDFIK